LGAGLVVAGCAAAPGSSAKPVSTALPASAPAGGTPKRGGTLRWGIEADLATLDPVWTTVAVTTNVATNLYDPLLAYDANLKPQPVLLKDFTVSSDKLTYTFNLREDATFDGGRPITSADVVASIERWGKKAAAGTSLFAAMNSLQAKGDHSFILETKQPYGLDVQSL